MTEKAYIVTAEDNLEKARKVLKLERLPDYVNCGGGRIIPTAWATLGDLADAAERLALGVEDAKRQLYRLRTPDLRAVADAMGVDTDLARVAVDAARRELQFEAARLEGEHAAFVELAHAARSLGLTRYEKKSAVDAVISGDADADAAAA